LDILKITAQNIIINLLYFLLIIIGDILITIILFLYLLVGELSLLCRHYNLLILHFFRFFLIITMAIHTICSSHTWIHHWSLMEICISLCLCRRCVRPDMTFIIHFLFYKVFNWIYITSSIISVIFNQLSYYPSLKYFTSF